MMKPYILDILEQFLFRVKRKAGLRKSCIVNIATSNILTSQFGRLIDISMKESKIQLPAFLSHDEKLPLGEDFTMSIVATPKFVEIEIVYLRK